VVLIPQALLDDGNGGSSIDIDVMNDERVKVTLIPFISNFHYSNCFEDENGHVIFDTVLFSVM
jgi:hypothetical protein